ncbi:CAP domain-containing protein [Corynebacterium wankanglinii]|uniref:CAP domain-containing protein n=1 Tax=Corynebacterium wankanglinii TaxID=2735136 RepID=A0A838CM35_9CORY|nr:CAP domain-containing protein [Corynebacterium wankanglinii]MBA1836291.1 CAP domain-containing protein [Corynebacterium wankanglinii]
MPNPQQLMQYAGAAVTVIVLILGLLFGSGDLSSSSPGSDTGAQSAPSKQSNAAPSNSGRKADSDGCVYGTPNYWECKQENNPIDTKNPRLTPSDIQQAKKDQFQQLVAWRARDKALRPITYDQSLDATAQRFAEELAQTPGDEIWHSGYNTRGRENVAMNPNYHDKFINMFAGSPGHASTMSTNGRAPKVGIGIAQDPVTGYYYCVQHFADH